MPTCQPRPTSSRLPPPGLRLVAVPATGCEVSRAASGELPSAMTRNLQRMRALVIAPSAISSRAGTRSCNPDEHWLLADLQPGRSLCLTLSLQRGANRRFSGADGSCLAVPAAYLRMLSSRRTRSGYVPRAFSDERCVHRGRGAALATLVRVPRHTRRGGEIRGTGHAQVDASIGDGRPAVGVLTHCT